MRSQADHMSVAKVFVGIAFMVVTFCIRKPQSVGIIGMDVMGLVKARLTGRFSYPFQAYE